MPTMASTIAFDYHIHVSNLYSMTPTQVGNQIDAKTIAQINEMLAQRIGTCSFTLTVATTTTTTTATIADGIASYSIGLSPKLLSMVLTCVAVVVGTVLA